MEHWDLGDGYTADQVDERTMGFRINGGDFFGFLRTATPEESRERDAMAVERARWEEKLSLRNPVEQAKWKTVDEEVKK